MDLIDKKARGHDAARILDEPLLKEALREVGLAAHRAFERATSDEELRVARQTLDAAERFVRMLRIAVGEGAAATKRLERELRPQTAVSRAIRAVRERRQEGMPWENAS